MNGLFAGDFLGLAKFIMASDYKDGEVLRSAREIQVGDEIFNGYWTTVTAIDAGEFFVTLKTELGEPWEVPRRISIRTVPKS